MLFGSKSNNETMQIVNGLIHMESLHRKSSTWPADIWKVMASLNVAVAVQLVLHENFPGLPFGSFSKDTGPSEG